MTNLSFSGLLPPLLFSLLFLLPAWYFWRLGRRAVAAVPVVIALGLFIYTLAIYVQDARRIQAGHDLEVLLTELSRPDLLEISDLRGSEEILFLAGSASLALSRSAAHFPDRASDIGRALAGLAEFAAARENFPQWRRSTDWDRELFFVAHAGAVLGHFQLLTGEDTYADQFRRIGRHLAGRLRRARYKHLISREGEDYLRPADNAAALYTLRLYDRVFGEEVSAPTFREWTGYVSDELYYAESRLPCAAFSATNRCRLEPSAVASGLYISYRAMADPDPVVDDIPWVEWLHYFKRSSFTPFSLSVRASMRDGEDARFCGLGGQPLSCDHFEEEIGMWAAAEYGGWYTYFRLFSGPVLQRWLGAPTNYAAMRTAARVPALTELALRLVAEGHE